MRYYRSGRFTTTETQIKEEYTQMSFDFDNPTPPTSEDEDLVDVIQPNTLSYAQDRLSNSPLHNAKVTRIKESYRRATDEARGTEST